VRPARLAAACGAALVVLVSGCAITPSLRPPVADPQKAFEQRTREMAAIDAWQVSGRLAVKTNKRGDTFNMFWRRDGDHHKISLYGPLGSGGVMLTQDEQSATLVDSKHKTYHDHNAEELLYEVAGWRVPFKSMQHWLLGVPAPESDYQMKLDQWGRLTELTQNGWRIQFLEYDYDNGRDLPRKLVINALPGTQHIVGGEPGENDNIQVKAVIQHWDWLRN
jgi:outer membrane lipoprotein LolB